MNYNTFEKTMLPFPVFSIKDIEKYFTTFDSRRLVEWQQKGYIIKLRRGYYCFAGNLNNENSLFFAANKIYSPSYISLESALSFYGMIPEGVFTITSITSMNTANFETSIGAFNYRHLKNRLFFGYTLIKYQNTVFKLAEAEKAILDFLYLNKIDSLDELEEIRLNKHIFNEIINLDKLQSYQKVFDSKVLDKRIRYLKKL